MSSWPGVGQYVSVSLTSSFMIYLLFYNKPIKLCKATYMSRFYIHAAHVQIFDMVYFTCLEFSFPQCFYINIYIKILNT